MNKCIFLIALLFMATTSVAEEPQLADENIPFLYESRADIPAPDHKMASLISIEYKKAEDEFTRQDLFKVIQPVLRKRMAEAKVINSVFVRVNTTIGEYDFDKSAFPTGFSETTYIPYDNGYAATFINIKNILFLPVLLEKAKAYASLLRNSRKGIMIISADIQDAQEKELDWRHNKVLILKAKKYILQHEIGKEFGSITIE